jgi:acyl dehydratase/CBS domain-containing protein
MPFPIRVADVMQRPVSTVSPDSTAASAAARCDEEDIGSLVVVDDGEPVGIVTNADFVRVLGTVDDPGGRPVESVMSAPVVTTTPDATIGEAVQTMRDADVSRLVVLEDDEIVGILSTDDVSRVVPQILHRSELERPEQDVQYRVSQETAFEESDWEAECLCGSDQTVDVGDSVTFAKTLTESDVRTFATASGDTNRLHLDSEFARGTRFGRRIVHGTLVSGLISAALARLPGVTIYVSQDLSFLAPVDIGDRVKAVCEVVNSLDGNKFMLTTDVFDEDDTQVIEGQAVVLVDSPPETSRVEVEALADV